MGTFFDPSFKHFDFIPQATSDEAHFKRNLLKDIDEWMVAEMKVVAEKLEEHSESNQDRLEFLCTVLIYSISHLLHVYRNII